MHILLAFAGMAADLGWRDTPARLIDGIDRWEDDVREVVRCAEAAGVLTGTMHVTFSGADRFRTWRASAWSIVQALDRQAETAARERLEAHAAAASAASAAADAEAAAAAAQGDAAAGLAAQAEEYRAAAGAALALADACIGWETAARDAAFTGGELIAGETPIAVRVGEALAHAGGAREVPANKRYATTSGGGR